MNELIVITLHLVAGAFALVAAFIVALLVAAYKDWQDSHNQPEV